SAGGSSSGNATGDVGSSYKEALETSIKLATGYYSDMGGAEDELSAVELKIADCDAVMQRMIDATYPEECPVSEDGIDVGAFLEDHGDALQEDIEEAVDVGEDAVELTTEPEVDPVDLGNTLTEGAFSLERYYETQTHAWLLAGAEGVLYDAAGQMCRANPDDVDALDTRINALEMMFDDKISANEAAHADLEAKQVPSDPLPEGAMTVISEGMEGVKEISQYISGSTEVDAPPSEDIAVTIANAEENLDATKTQLADQKTTLGEQKTRMTSSKASLTGVADGIRTETEAIEAAATEVATEKDTTVSEASGELSDANAKGDKAVEDVSKLAAWRLKVDEEKKKKDEK
ncbi:MAG: hypothetical protein QF464_02125, partial [Myxococcota bacterium]|nr:hypothetical protein [Myxococcota bacterium]